jgi:hypothetical protein
MSKHYLGILNFDYSNSTDGNARYLIAQALEQVGWTYAETSAFVLQSDDLLPFRQALDLLSRSAELPGTVSSLNLVVQLVDERLTVPGARRSNPLGTILDYPSPY